jgi:hypothetical protein
MTSQVCCEAVDLALPPDPKELAVLDHGNPRRVIATIFSPMETFE